MSTNNNLNTHFTLVGSNFHGSFLDILKSKPEQYVVTTVSSFTEFKAPGGQQIRAIVLQDHDDELAKATTLAQLLEQPIVLAFFAPSKDVLDALQKASKSLVHIPSIKLEVGAPIIIHKRPDDGVISLTPGFTVSTEDILVTNRGGTVSEEAVDSSPAPTPDEKLPTNFAKAVNMIQLTVEYHSELLRRAAQPRTDDGLRPPLYIQFYKAIDLSMTFDAYPRSWGEEPSQGFRYEYRIRVHAYCANAKPTEPGFAENGGEVHVVAVLGGEIFRIPFTSPRQYVPREKMFWFLDQAFFRARPRPGESALAPVQGEPRYEQANGLDAIYKIDFGADFMMWTQDNPEKFPAKYVDTFTRHQFKQRVQGQEGGYNVLIYYHNHYDGSPDLVPYEGEGGYKNVFDEDNDPQMIKSFPSPDYIPLHALFHWKTSSLSSHTIDTLCFVSSSRFDISGEHHIMWRPRTENGRDHTLDLSAGNWE